MHPSLVYTFPMSRTHLIVLLVLVLAIGIGVAFYLVHSERSAMQGNTEQTPSLTGQAIFTDGEDGFSIRYPEEYQTDDTFMTFYHLPANWRVNAAPHATGTPVIALIGYRTQSENTYPRYFDAEVRIGVSSDPKEVARCEQVGNHEGETALPDTVIGGATFKVFAFESAGMMQYLKGISYRTVHEGKCFAIEQLQTGSSYREDPMSSKDIPDTTLQAHYNALADVVKTFSFSRP